MATSTPEIQNGGVKLSPTDLQTTSDSDQPRLTWAGKKVVGLVSGGKDSIFNLQYAVGFGLEVCCLANLCPPGKYESSETVGESDEKAGGVDNDDKSEAPEELDSWMYQSVGSDVVPHIAKAMGIPLYRRPIKGKQIQETLHYEVKRPATPETPEKSGSSSSSTVREIEEPSTGIKSRIFRLCENPESLCQEQTGEGKDEAKGEQKAEEKMEELEDETEDLFHLLSEVKKHHPDIFGVCSGAVFSDYQRLRVENVCARLGLMSFGYLWRRDQGWLMEKMNEDPVFDCKVIKVCSLGLTKEHVNRSIRELHPIFRKLNNEHGFHICGEGGEYETSCMRSVLFKESAKLDWQNPSVIAHDVNNDVYYLAGGEVREGGTVVAEDGNAETDGAPSRESVLSNLSSEFDSLQIYNEKISKLLPPEDESAPADGVCKSLQEKQLFSATKWEVDLSAVDSSALSCSSSSSSPPPNLKPTARHEPLISVVGDTWATGDLDVLSMWKWKGNEEPLYDFDHFGEDAPAAQAEILFRWVREEVLDVMKRRSQGSSSSSSAQEYLPIFADLQVRDMNSFAAINKKYVSELFPNNCNPPARCCYQTCLPEGVHLRLRFFGGAFPHPSRSTSLKITHVQSISTWAMACIGPYSQAAQISDFGDGMDDWSDSESEAAAVDKADKSPKNLREFLLGPESTAISSSDQSPRGLVSLSDSSAMEKVEDIRSYNHEDSSLLLTAGVLGLVPHTMAFPKVASPNSPPRWRTELPLLMYSLTNILDLHNANNSAQIVNVLLSVDQGAEYSSQKIDLNEVSQEVLRYFHSRYADVGGNATDFLFPRVLIAVVPRLPKDAAIEINISVSEGVMRAGSPHLKEISKLGEGDKQFSEKERKFVLQDEKNPAGLKEHSFVSAYDFSHGRFAVLYLKRPEKESDTHEGKTDARKTGLRGWLAQLLKQCEKKVSGCQVTYVADDDYFDVGSNEGLDGGNKFLPHTVARAVSRVPVVDLGSVNGQRNLVRVLLYLSDGIDSNEKGSVSRRAL